MGLEHVETITASSQSTVDFTNVFGSSDGADRYVIFIDNIIPATDAAELDARVSSDGGSSWDSGSSDYAYSRHLTYENGGTGATGSSGTSKDGQVIHDCGGSPSNNDTQMCVMTVHDPTNSNRATVWRKKASSYRNSDGTPYNTQMSGAERLAQSSVDSIRFLMSSGDISSGIFSIFKVTQSAASGMDHIETIEASSQSSVDFTNVFSSSDGYDRYRIFVDNLIPSGTDLSFRARFSTDGGSTWDNGSSDYAYSAFAVNEASNTHAVGSSGDSSIRLEERLVSSSTLDNHSANIIISDPTDSNRATILRNSFIGNNTDYNDSLHPGYSGGIRLTQSAIDSIRFLMSSGKISSGTFSVYGLGS